LPCYCYAIETNDRTIRRKFRNLPLALVQCECHTGKKLSIQELYKFIGIKMLTSCFLEILDS